MSVWAGMVASKRVFGCTRPWSWASAPQSEAALLDNSVRRRWVLPEGLSRQSSLEWRTPTGDKNVALVLRGRRQRRLASSRLADAPKTAIPDVDFLVPAAALPVGLSIGGGCPTIGMDWPSVGARLADGSAEVESLRVLARVTKRASAPSAIKQKGWGRALKCQ